MVTKVHSDTFHKIKWILITEECHTVGMFGIPIGFSYFSEHSVAKFIPIQNDKMILQINGLAPTTNLLEAL